jgi:hypothetical protein
MAAAVSDEAAEDRHQQEERQQDHQADEERQLGRQDVREVDEDGGRARDEHLHPRVRRGVGQCVGPERVDQVGGGGVLGCRLRIDVQQHHVPAARLGRDEERLGDLGHVGLLGHIVDDGVDDVSLVRLDDTDEHQGPVEAWTEALRQRVEGDPGRRTGRVRPLVGGAQAQREERQGDDDDHDQCQRRREPRVSLHPVGPVGPEALVVGPDDARAVLGQVPLLLAAHHLGPDESEKGGEKRQSGDHREGHADGSGDREPVKETHPQGEHPEERDAHDDAGEQDGTPGGIDRVDDGGLAVMAGDQALAVTGHDEQRIVDAHAEADEKHELGGELGHADDVAEQADDADRRPECE